jgi:hypothetical protein
VVAAGWFYWRNQRLYGTPTADAFLLAGLRREDRGTLIGALRDLPYHRDMWSGLYGVVHPRLSAWHPVWVVAGLVSVTITGLAVAAVRRHRAGRAGSEHRDRPDGRDEHRDRAEGRDDGRGATIGPAGWAVIAGFFVAVVVATARFYADGGGPHPRYLLSVVPVASALLARGLAELPLRRVLLTVVVAAQLAVTVSQLVQFGELVGHPDHPRPFDHATAGLAAQRSSIALAVSAGVGLVAVLGADWWLARRGRGASASATTGGGPRVVGTG